MPIFFLHCNDDKCIRMNPFRKGHIKSLAKPWNTQQRTNTKPCNKGPSLVRSTPNLRPNNVVKQGGRAHGPCHGVLKNDSFFLLNFSFHSVICTFKDVKC